MFCKYHLKSGYSPKLYLTKTLLDAIKKHEILLKLAIFGAWFEIGEFLRRK